MMVVVTRILAMTARTTMMTTAMIIRIIITMKMMVSMIITTTMILSVQGPQVDIFHSAVHRMAL